MKDVKNIYTWHSKEQDLKKNMQKKVEPITAGKKNGILKAKLP